MSKTLPTLAALAVVALTSVTDAQQPKRVDDAALKRAPMTGEDWLSHGMDPGEKRFSPLKQIDATNVNRLARVWSFDVPPASGGPGGVGNQETTLLEWNGALYGMTNFSLVFAVDARTGKQLWKWDPEVNRATVASKVCCGIVSRGVAVYDGKIIAPILDGRLVALDVVSGKPVWEARVAYPQEQYTLTMAPRIAKGKVVIGVSGADYPVRGYVDAFDARTGRHEWRFYTVPGDPSKGFENEALRKAAPTWSGEWWKLGGGASVWDGMAYDPDANLVYFGTGNGGPWPEGLRGSKGKENLYVCSIIALNPDNGEMKWYYQVVPGDSWDYDSVQQLTLADLTINGRQRKVIMQASKNGFFYVIDRVSGEFISAAPFAPLNWAKGVDPITGKPLIHPEAFYEKDPVTISPGPLGAHNWAPMAFNPITGLMYVPATFGSQRTFKLADNFTYREGRMNTGTVGTPILPPGGAPGAAGVPAPPLAAGAQPTVPPIQLPMIGPAQAPGTQSNVLVGWDPVAQKEAWRAPVGGNRDGGVLTTAGNLVIQVVTDGRLIAYSADKGQKLAEINTGQRTGMGPPMTYMVDGKQYIALMGGRGSGSLVPAADDVPLAQRTVTAASDAAPPRVLVYALDGK